MTVSADINSGGRKNGHSNQFVDCLHAGDTDYTATTGIDVSVNDFEPSEVFVGLILSEGTGNIAFEMEMGGVMTIPFAVSADEASARKMDGYRMAKILTSGTTFTGNIWPVW